MQKECSDVPDIKVFFNTYLIYSANTERVSSHVNTKLEMTINPGLKEVKRRCESLSVPTISILHLLVLSIVSCNL